MAKNIKRNYIYNLFYQILSIVTPLITTPYLSRVLGADGIGTVSYVESIVSYFTLFATMGITIHGQREISYVQDSIEQRSITFWNTKLFSLCTSAVALVLYVIFSLQQGNPQIYIVFSLAILSVAADVTWFFQGMEEFGKIVLRNVIFKIINIAYVFIVIRSAEDVLLYAFGHVCFTFLSHVLLWGNIPQYIQKIHIKDLHPFKDAKVVLSLFVPTIAIQIYTVLDKTMIGIITQNAFENGYYEQALKVTRMVLSVVTALGAVMIPRIGYHFERSETEKVKHLMLISYRFVWFLGIPMCLGLIGIANNFAPWFFGPDYEKIPTLLSILALLILAIGISNVTGMQYLVPTKRQKFLSMSVILGALTNFTLNMFLIKTYGAVGAAVASVAAEIVVAASQLFFVRKEISTALILKQSVPYGIAGIVMFISILFLRNALVPSIINTAVLIGCGAVIYSTMLIVLRDEFFASNVKKMGSKFIRK